MAGPGERSAIVRTCDEAEETLKLFLQGKFDEAETFVEEKARTRDKIPGAVPIFTHCHAVILFAKAGISGAEEDRKQAIDRLQEAASMAGEHIPKQGWVQSIASWGMAYFMTPSPKSADISEEELSCRIIEAEATYLSALLCFFEESVAAFFKAALLIRRALRGYKHCHGILERQGDYIGNEHDVGAVKLGFGGFSVAISMLPPKLLRLLSVLGFPSDRNAGLRAVEESLRCGGLRASVAGGLLLSYHVILPAFFSIPQEREQHVMAAECVFCLLNKQYPNSFFLSFYRGRLQRLKGDLAGSTDCFLRLDEGLKLHPDSKFFKLRHAWVYELGLGYMLQLQWEDAEKYWMELKQHSIWSRAFFAYMHGVCLSMRGLPKSAADEFAKVQGLMRGTVSGRVLAEEQYVCRKVTDHALDTEEGVKSLQGQICGAEFLYLWNSFPQMPCDKLEGILRIIEEAERSVLASSNCEESKLGEGNVSFRSLQVCMDQIGVAEDAEDDMAICNLIKGTVLRELGNLDAAQACLEGLREESCFVETELFIYPMAAYERALVLINRHTEQALKDPDEAARFEFLFQAKRELTIAESFKQDYNFLWRLLGRVHAAHGAIQGLMGEEGRTSIDSTIIDCDTESDHWQDDEDLIDRKYYDATFNALQNEDTSTISFQAF